MTTPNQTPNLQTVRGVLESTANLLKSLKYLPEDTERRILQNQLRNYREHIKKHLPAKEREGIK